MTQLCLLLHFLPTNALLATHILLDNVASPWPCLSPPSATEDAFTDVDLKRFILVLVSYGGAAG